MKSMLTYFQDPSYELALSGGALYSLVGYTARLYECSNMLTFHTFSLAMSSIWFHCTKSIPAFWVDQIVLNTWVLTFLYEAYLRHWLAVGIVTICILYAFLMFYVGQSKHIYAYHPSRFWSIFFHQSVHLFSAVLAVIIITMFPVPK